ncbi:NACHT domain-containing protein [Kitasatospora sp. NPDC088346]|uniref:NACHT domain-containing protein n=1 Tax=Kitasatospora sp. NPDC088346 TaxID=3364073 RepID=UPI00381AAA45
MPDYDLNRLGSRAFEQMVVALARRELGPGVRVFGDGPDGGREATFEGTINWSATSEGVAPALDVWTGYTVLQAKFQVKPKATPRDNALWLQQEIRKELDHWLEAAKNHTRLRLPDYLIFVSNVELSSVARVGGIDKIDSFVSSHLEKERKPHSRLRVKGVVIWHADQIRSMLDAHQSVRWAFPGLLTVGDVMSRLSPERVSLGSLEARDPLREELLHSLKADRWVRLSQSGGPGDAKLWLDDIAIDLPAAVEAADGGTVQAVRYVLELGDMVLRPREPDRVRRPNLVLVGGPGQGKSTLSQLIAQAYRTAMLTDADTGPGAEEILAGTREAMNRLDLPVPGNRRWPTRIDLAKYAEELASGAEVSLLRWISRQILRRTDRDVSAQALRDWLAAWPWALILDGLDEVPSQADRRLVYDKIDELLTTAEDRDADLLVVVTTRPTGYDERFSADTFRHLFLQRLPADHAAAFARQITDKRFTNDDEMRSKVGGRMVDASRDPVTLRLMETPLQVTIMSFIVEKFPTLPPDRFTLFNLYYQTMFEREVAKDIPIARFLSQHRIHIDRLHEQVGLTLQAASETADGAEAAMNPEDLHALAVARFVSRGFEPAQADRGATDLVRAATQRLVLLAPRDGGVGFDIRTLQELMAARALTEGDDLQVMARLRLIAHHPHWRNTWLLAAGHLLLASERFERSLLTLLKQLDTDSHRLNGRFPTAPSLAAEILDDNLARDRPRFERGLAQCLFTVLDHPPVNNRIGLGAALVRLARPPHRRLVFDRLHAAASAGAAQRAAAALVLQGMRRASPDPGQRVNIDNAYRHLALSQGEAAAVEAWLDARQTAGEAARMSTMAAHLEALVEPYGLSPEDRQLLHTGLAVLGDSRFKLLDDAQETAVPSRRPPGRPEALLTALRREDIAQALEFALENAPSSHWAIEATLGYAFKSAQNRQPVGPALLRSIAEANASADEADGW